eukprot:NODE_993_length_2768_cov_0.533158.p2 type:complete len:192 gc:universal NODE_993_length_2768_cov_0.533158:2235-1660(-)
MASFYDINTCHLQYCMLFLFLSLFAIPIIDEHKSFGLSYQTIIKRLGELPRIKSKYQPLSELMKEQPSNQMISLEELRQAADKLAETTKVFVLSKARKEAVSDIEFQLKDDIEGEEPLKYPAIFYECFRQIELTIDEEYQQEALNLVKNEYRAFYKSWATDAEYTEALRCEDESEWIANFIIVYDGLLNLK